jgi:hypothetical protein
MHSDHLTQRRLGQNHSLPWALISKWARVQTTDPCEDSLRHGLAQSHRDPSAPIATKSFPWNTTILLCMLHRRCEELLECFPPLAVGLEHKRKKHLTSLWCWLVILGSLGNFSSGGGGVWVTCNRAPWWVYHRESAALGYQRRAGLVAYRCWHSCHEACRGVSGHSCWNLFPQDYIYSKIQNPMSIKHSKIEIETYSRNDGKTN